MIMTKRRQYLNTSCSDDTLRSIESHVFAELLLFEECLLDDDSAKCEELDAALAEFELSLCGIKGPWIARSKLDRAIARVRAASSKFGDAQLKGADDFIEQAKASWNGKECTVSSATLLEMQVALFDECVLDEGGGSARCIELEEALVAFRAAISGSSVEVELAIGKQAKVAVVETDEEEVGIEYQVLEDNLVTVAVERATLEAPAPVKAEVGCWVNGKWVLKDQRTTKADTKFTLTLKTSKAIGLVLKRKLGKREFVRSRLARWFGLGA